MVNQLYKLFQRCRIFILFLVALTNTNTSPLRMLIPMLLFTMPLSPLKPMRMLTGLLYSQYRMVLSRLNIAGCD